MSTDPEDFLRWPSLSREGKDRVWADVLSRLEVAPRVGRARRRRRQLAGALACLAVCGGAAGVAALLSAGPAVAWAPVPSLVAGRAAAAAASSCRSDLAQLEAHEHSLTFPGSPTVLLVEQRGTTTSVLVTGGGLLGECIGVTSGPYSSVRTAIVPVPAPSRSATLSLVDNGVISGPAGVARVIIGRVSPAVAAVQVRTASGLIVHASVTGGFYMAWWPNATPLVSLAAKGRDGAVISTLEPAVPGPARAQPPTYYAH